MNDAGQQDVGKSTGSVGEHLGPTLHLPARALTFLASGSPTASPVSRGVPRSSGRGCRSERIFCEYFGTFVRTKQWLGCRKAMVMP